MRLFITVLSMGSVISFGYALAGYGSRFLGGERSGNVFLWLGLGVLLAAFALLLWKRVGENYILKEDDVKDSLEEEGPSAEKNAGPGPRNRP